MILMSNTQHALLLHLNGFIHHYRDGVINYLSRNVDAQALTRLCHMLLDTIRRRGHIYVFGNGGSYAISRQFETTLLESLEEIHYPLRLRWGIDYHASQSIVRRFGYEQIFKQVLRQEYANENDIVLLVSGSGNSSNILVAAEYCRENAIPCVGIAAFHGGELCLPNTVDLALPIDIDDQQLGEDVMQSLLQIAAYNTAAMLESEDCSVECSLTEYIAALHTGYNAINAELLCAIGAAVSEAYLDNQRVYVLAPEGGGVSLSAEHVSHNLNWDAVYEVRVPPRRNLTSTPSGCDFSGIGNDRFLAGIVSCQQLSVASPGDVLILFAVDATEAAVQETLSIAINKNMRIYLIAGNAPRQTHSAIVFKQTQRAVVADLCQACGHLLGRLIRLNLKIHEDGQVPSDDLLSYLIDDDLAQRRLLHVIDGV